MRKNIGTYFLLLVLTIQILPVQQMGSMLFSNQFNEEIPHACETDSPLSKAVLKSNFLSSKDLIFHASFISSPKHLHTAVAIPQNHTGDIHVPPPNC